MGEQLTRSDVKKIKEEIEYRKLVVRKRELEAVKAVSYTHLDVYKRQCLLFVFKDNQLYIAMNGKGAIALIT